MEHFGTYNQICRTNEIFEILKSDSGMEDQLCTEANEMALLKNIRGNKAKESFVNYGSTEMQKV